MLCPNCHSLMSSRGAINPIPTQPGRERMDLHCYRFDGTYEGYPCGTHMGVITEDPKIWECHEYNFKLNFNNKYYELHGFNNKVDWYHQSRDYGQKTFLREYAISNILIEVDFIPISTGDNMHEEAWKLFHKLREFSIFA